MATKRLIDANALVETFEKWKVEIHDAEDYNPDVYDAIDSCVAQVEDAPTVDAAEAVYVREFAKDVVYQFGYYCQNGGRLHITHGGLSTLEWAFDILGWENPHPVPECECEIDGCHEYATCGAPTADGYKRMCSKHYREMRTKTDGGSHEID